MLARVSGRREGARSAMTVQRSSRRCRRRPRSPRRGLGMPCARTRAQAASCSPACSRGANSSPMARAADVPRTSAQSVWRRSCIFLSIHGRPTAARRAISRFEIAASSARDTSRAIASCSRRSAARASRSRSPYMRSSSAAASRGATTASLEGASVIRATSLRSVPGRVEHLRRSLRASSIPAERLVDSRARRLASWPRPRVRPVAVRWSPMPL